MRMTRNGATLGPESETSPVGGKKHGTAFDPTALLAKAGIGETIFNLNEKDIVFSQGDLAETVFYIQRGQVKLTVATQSSKGATISLLGAGDFIGEECITPDHPTRMATATALTECTVLRVDKKEMLRVLHEEPVFSGLFVSYLLARSTQLEADLVE